MPSDGLRRLLNVDNNTMVTVEELVSSLMRIKEEVLSNWDKIKDVNNIKPKESALGAKMHYLRGFSLHFLVTTNATVNNADQILAGFLISDASPVKFGSTYAITLNSPDPRLAAALLITLINYLNTNGVKDYVYITVSEGKTKVNASFKHIIEITGKLRDKIGKFIVDKEKAETLLNNPKVPDYLIPWLRDALSNWDSIKVRKQVRFIYYAVNGLLGRASLFGWFLGDGVLGHVGRGSFDIGLSFVVDEPVRRFMGEFLCSVYGCSGSFFSGSSAKGSEHYVPCPVKALVINDIAALANAWPAYGLTDRVIKLVDAVKYSIPCLSYAKYPVIDVLGHGLILRKHNMGRGWYLARSTSNGGLAVAIFSDLRSAGFNVSLNRRGGGFEIYVPIEDTRRILRMLGIYERFYGGPRRLPSLDEVVSVLRRYSIRRW
uniref:hypothetical protein n=1 Tax=Caldivirga sp. UBA161 TaxID=1915569 RepID=UPI0025BAFA40